jgi:predicted RND superfamily exporter protein
VPVERLGVMTALTMLVCVLGDLLLLPAILASIRI